MNELRKRPGRFEISESFLESDRSAKQIMELIMSNVFIIRCEHDYARGTFLYDAYSMKFDVIEEGNLAPLYTFEFTKGHDGETRLSGVSRKEDEPMWKHDPSMDFECELSLPDGWKKK